MTQQFSKVTLPTAIARYKNGHLTAKGLLCFYFEIKLKPGWEMKKSPNDIYTELGISRAAFYRAYSALIAEGIIEGEDPDLQKLVIKRPVSDLRQQSQCVESESQIIDNPSQPVENESQIIDSKSQSVENESQPVENQSSNPAQNGNSDDSPDFSPDSYSHFYLNSYSDFLSDTEREREKNRNLKFFHIQDEITQEAILKVGYRYFLAQLPQYPALPEKWIKCNAIAISQNDFFVLEYNRLVKDKSSADFSRGKTEA